MVHKFLVATFATIWNNFLTLFRLIDYRTLLACLVLTIVLWPLIWVGFIRPTKPVLEIASVVITGLITFSLILRFALTRHLFLLWAAGFMAITMCREIHFTGSDELLLIGWPILLGVALWRYDLFKSYLMKSCSDQFNGRRDTFLLSFPNF